MTTEIQPLKDVLVHTPGRELLAVTPQTRREYLYDDLLDLDRAQQEHRVFKNVLRRFARVHELRDLLLETLQQPHAREFLLRHAMRATGMTTLFEPFHALDAATIVDRFIVGWKVPTGPFSSNLGRPAYLLPPLPNLFFTRDATMILGQHAIIANMRHSSRWPEAALMRTVFACHPEFSKTNVLHDGTTLRHRNLTVEGGDVHVLSPDVVMVGVSPRTQAAALDALTDTLFDQTSITDVIAVVLPEGCLAIHLDMIWTQLDHDLCAAHPSLIEQPGWATILHRQRGYTNIRRYTSILEALASVGMNMDVILCGGDTPESQARNLWRSGCNFFTVAPGVVMAYDSNEETLAAMARAGFRVVSASEFLAGSHLPQTQTVITFTGSELIRGGGGPRCMTCPLQRVDNLT